MAKAYAFRLNAQRAEFYPGGAGVAYGSGCTLAQDSFEGTLAQGLERLAKFSADNATKPHAAFLRMASASARKPAGFDKAETCIYCRGQA